MPIPFSGRPFCCSIIGCEPCTDVPAECCGPSVMQRIDIMLPYAHAVCRYPGASWDGSSAEACCSGYGLAVSQAQVPTAITPDGTLGTAVTQTGNDLPHYRWDAAGQWPESVSQLRPL